MYWSPTIMKLVCLMVIPVALADSQLFTQKVDHFGATDGTTFQQRYWQWSYVEEGTNPEYVFLMLGGELGESAADGGDYMAWIDYAKQFHAVCFLLEHRFYGESIPDGEYPANIEYLSSDQALEDMAQFIKAQQFSNAKWVTFGGSYSGSLAAWARQKYPDLVHAAIASSAPLLAEVMIPDFAEVYDEEAECTSRSQHTLGLTPFSNRHQSRARSCGTGYDDDTSWNYQSCHEFGWIELDDTTVTEDQLVSLYCNGDWETIRKGISYINNEHSGTNFTAERVLFIHGSCDAWRLAGLTVSHNDRIPVFMIKGGGHCDDMTLMIPQDESEWAQGVRNAQDTARQYLSQWLNET